MERQPIQPIDPKIVDAVEQTIQQYERGELTYDEANQSIVKQVGDHPVLYFMQVELFCAQQLKEQP